jgi:hypothetical protein
MLEQGPNSKLRQIENNIAGNINTSLEGVLSSL